MVEVLIVAIVSAYFNASSSLAPNAFNICIKNSPASAPVAFRPIPKSTTGLSNFCICSGLLPKVANVSAKVATSLDVLILEPATFIIVASNGFN